MTKTETLPVEQWEALEAAERPIYDGQHGVHAYTSVMPREEGGIAVAMWAHAEEQVDLAGDFDEWDTRKDEETARRVAAALATLAFGTDFLS